MRHKILYVSGKRASEECPVLSFLETHNKISFSHVEFDLGSLGLLAFLKSLLTIFRVSMADKPDLILIEGASFSTLAGVVVKKIFRIPLVIRLKGDLWREYFGERDELPFFYGLRRSLNYHSGVFVLRRADMILALSGVVTDSLRCRLGLETPMHIVHIPLNELKKPDFSEVPADVRGPFVVTVINFNFWSKVGPLASSARKISQILKEYGVSWVILGEGIFLEKFKAQLNQEINSGDVKVIGRRDPYHFYKKARAQFYISGLDTLSNVLLESFYFKLPVMVNADFPVKEVVQKDFNVCFADIYDTNNLEHSIERILFDDSYRERLIQNAYVYVKEQFSLEKISEEMEHALLMFNEGRKA